MCKHCNMHSLSGQAWREVTRELLSLCMDVVSCRWTRVGNPSLGHRTICQMESKFGQPCELPNSVYPLACLPFLQSIHLIQNIHIYLSPMIVKNCLNKYFLLALAYHKSEEFANACIKLGKWLNQMDNWTGKKWATSFVNDYKDMIVSV